MSIFTLRDLEFVASLKQSWSRLYVIELTRLVHELDEPYLLRLRGPPRQRLAGPSAGVLRARRDH
ncbi:MAG TPA: hypothetical protein VIQ05_11425 [Tardiphaga sp.]